jgi:hypothetical protein
VANYLIRVHLPDRPGALGAVASRIGAVGGDVVSIDILQREQGSVIDDFGVELAGEDLVELLRSEILEVDGVMVEALRLIDGPVPDRHAEILDIATSLFHQTSPTGVLEYLTNRACESVNASFAAALDPLAPWPTAVSGDVPPDDELRDLAVTLQAAEDAGERPEVGADCVRLPLAGALLVVGRPDMPFRSRERTRIATMAELADHRWRELTSRSNVG